MNRNAKPSSNGITSQSNEICSLSDEEIDVVSGGMSVFMEQVLSHVEYYARLTEYCNFMKC
jgi:hypothetical protein